MPGGKREHRTIVIIDGMRLAVDAYDSRDIREKTGDSDFYADQIIIKPLDAKFWSQVDETGVIFSEPTTLPNEIKNVADKLERLCDFLDTAQDLKEFVDPSQRAYLRVELSVLNDLHQTKAEDAKMHRHVYDKVVQRIYAFKRQEEGRAHLSPRHDMLEALEVMVCEEFDRLQDVYFDSIGRRDYDALRDTTIDRFKETFKEPPSQQQLASAFETFRQGVTEFFTSHYGPQAETLQQDLIKRVMRRTLEIHQQSNRRGAN